MLRYELIASSHMRSWDELTSLEQTTMASMTWTNCHIPGHDLLTNHASGKLYSLVAISKVCVCLAVVRFDLDGHHPSGYESIYLLKFLPLFAFSSPAFYSGHAIRKHRHFSLASDKKQSHPACMITIQASRHPDHQPLVVTCLCLSHTIYSLISPHSSSLSPYRLIYCQARNRLRI